MKKRVRALTILTSAALLSAPLAALQADDAAKPWTLGERNGRQWLLTPEGQPFLILGLSHASAAFDKTQPMPPQLDRAEAQLRGWGFNTIPAQELWDRFPFIVPLDRLVGDQQNRFEDVFDPAFKARLRNKISTACAKTKGNPNCIGYWWTDIPPWPLSSKKQHGKNWVEYLRDLPDTAPGRLFVATRTGKVICYAQKDSH